MRLLKQRMIRCLFIMFIILSIPALSLAGEEGYFIIKDNETFLDATSGTPIMWQNKIWITDKNVRIENDQDKDHVLIIHMDKDKIYQLDLKARKYKILELPERIKDLQGKREIKSERLDEPKRFGEWDCYGVKLNTKNNDVTLDAEYWLTKALDVPSSLRSKVAKYFGVDQENLTEELNKYEGYPVYIKLLMKLKDKTVKMNTLVMELKKLEIDSKLFEIPDDFVDAEVALKGASGVEPALKGPSEEKVEDPNQVPSNEELKDPDKKKENSPAPEAGSEEGP